MPPVAAPANTHVIFGSLDGNFERTLVFEKNYEKLSRNYYCSHCRFFICRNG